MSRLSVASTIALSAVVVRQTFVLSAIVRSRRFLRGAPAARPATAVQEPVTPAFFIVLQVLREAAILREVRCGPTGSSWASRSPG
jgi:hypothetical protein